MGKHTLCGPWTVQMHCYEVHPRFGHLQAPSIDEARLQLAALYAATSTLLPEPRSNLTGAQTAVQLVRGQGGGGRRIWARVYGVCNSSSIWHRWHHLDNDLIGRK